MYMKKIFIILILILSVIAAIYYFNPRARNNKIEVSVIPKDSLQKNHQNTIILGLNQNWSYFPELTNKEMISNIKLLNPQVFRYPGGTVTHSWDWESGKITSRKAKYIHKLDDVKLLQDETKSKVVFVLDIANNTLENQIKMLNQAERLGIKIEFVEFGNELYANDIPEYKEIFQSGSDYAKKVIVWNDEIKKVYPNAKTAALLLGRIVKSSNQRMYNWNKEVTGVLNMTRLDAYTYHVYIGEKSNFKETEVEFDTVLNNTDENNKEIWITEYGNQHNNSEGNYLAELKDLHNYLLKVPGVTMLLSHQIIGSQKNKISDDGLVLTPEGRMFIELNNLK